MTDEIDPDWTMRPGIILAEELAHRRIPHRMAARIIARQTGWTVTRDDILGVLTGTTPITTTIAAGLSALLGTSPDLWLNLEHNYRTALAAGKTDISDE